MSLPDIATRDEWLAARTALLAEEKALTHQRDRLNTKRRELPMVEVTKDYAFEGPDGTVGLLELFEGRQQLIVYDFMFHPEWDDGLPELHGRRGRGVPRLPRAPAHPRHHLRPRLAGPAREAGALQGGEGLVPALVLHERRRLHLRLRHHRRRLPRVRQLQLPHPRRVGGHRPREHAGLRAALRHARASCCFLQADGRVFHTYAVYARGLESLGGSYYFLDNTALGRQEDWEEPKGRSDAARGNTPDFSA